MYMHVTSDMHPRVHCLRPYYAPPDEQVGVQKIFRRLAPILILLHPHTKYTSCATAIVCSTHACSRRLGPVAANRYRNQPKCLI